MIASNEICMFVILRVVGHLEAVQLKALKEFLPTEEEEAGLNDYIKRASTTEEKRKAAFNDLCPCERYMVAMMKVPNASEKFDCMLFETSFQNRIDEIKESILTLSQACDDVKESLRLRKLMAMILTVGNQINTGGSGKLAAGFTLDALSKLNEVSSN